MFYPFTIKSGVINQLKLETGTYTSAGEDPEKYTRRAQLRQYLASTNGFINGKALKEVLFPKGKYHIFLSHSHGDLELAQYLKAWFNINCGLKCFIDADVWGNAYDLIKELDNKYSKTAIGSYNYDSCKQTTAHAYSMLTMALFEAIDEIECPIFIESANSITLEDGIKNQTLSPWIYEEVGYMGKLPHKKPSRIMIQSFSKAVDSPVLNEEVANLRMTHPLDLTSFKSIEYWDLVAMKTVKQEDALDLLYRRKDVFSY